MTIKVYNYDMIFESNVFRLNDAGLQIFEGLILSDSIFDFYPKCVCFLNDENGIISDGIYFVESSEFTIKFGNIDKGYVGTKFIWTGNEVSADKNKEFISGSNYLTFIHNFILKDKPKQKGWNDLISNIVKDILLTRYSFNAFQNITTTTGIQYHYQMNKSNQEFIKDLSNIAYSQSYEKSPYFTFFDVNGNFYFTTLDFLFNQQSVARIVLTQDSFQTAQSNTIDQNLIPSVKVLNSIRSNAYGFEKSRNFYNKKIYKIENTGAVTNVIELMKNRYLNLNRQFKLMVERINSSETETTDVNQIGIIESNEIEFNKGLVNNLYTNFNTLYRLNLIVEWNPLITAGKIIDLLVKSPDQNKNIGTEYSGKWLIASTQHYINMKGTPQITLELCRPGISVDRGHVLFNQLVSS
jgi:hypothetical protein